MKRDIRRSFPRQVTREDPAVTAVQVNQAGKQRCLVGGPGIPPEAFKRLNLRGEPKGSFSSLILQPGNRDRLQRSSRQRDVT